MKVEIKGQLMEGIFLERINRFIAHIKIEDKVQVAHVANTGRMKELLIKGTRVIVRKVDNSNRKTNYDLVMVYKNDTLVLIDSKMPNILIEKAFREVSLEDFGKYDYIKREVKYINSRFDIGLSNNREKVLVECKCATLVKDNGTATFPDAPTERGRKHILELIKAKEEGYRAVVFFIVQRNDAVLFTPNRDMDESFADAVKQAYLKGVEFYAYICDVTIEAIEIKQKIPVIIN
ncbi:DNA/RNA nuclease SfsA [Maledivibacter halophilus]|uniref:Sugar fermentation stimulation protein homolog n=1 Tax=Maledivibacter halophilus TaxID=36842 RepID=A0A1T5L0Q8_9FIRM|nr:DNA/RNA nuclease SfsA [Maledivibacter halophilus]SKC69636.1 sugar fermentation stimulation protein A [Maledivibacter halophilus]